MRGSHHPSHCRLLQVYVLRNVIHPNIIPVERAFLLDDFVGLVLPFSSYGSMQDQLRARTIQSCPRYFSEKTIWFMLYQIALGLKALHDAGFAHGDLKPSNIILNRDFKLWIADLGSAVKIGDRSGSLRPTLAYSAPEVLKRRPACYSSSPDLWALGCIAYELCELHHPFVERTQQSASAPLDATQVSSNIRNHEPRTMGERISPALRAVIFSLLEKDPHRRLDLDGFLGHVPPVAARQVRSLSALEAHPGHHEATSPHYRSTSSLCSQSGDARSPTRSRGESELSPHTLEAGGQAFALSASASQAQLLSPKAARHRSHSIHEPCATGSARATRAHSDPALIRPKSAVLSPQRSKLAKTSSNVTLDMVRKVSRRHSEVGMKSLL